MFMLPSSQLSMLLLLNQSVCPFTPFVGLFVCIIVCLISWSEEPALDPGHVAWDSQSMFRYLIELAITLWSWKMQLLILTPPSRSRLSSQSYVLGIFCVFGTYPSGNFVNDAQIMLDVSLAVLTPLRGQLHYVNTILLNTFYIIGHIMSTCCVVTSFWGLHPDYWLAT
jgi:hypothetical protein